MRQERGRFDFRQVPRVCQVPLRFLSSYFLSRVWAMDAASNKDTSPTTTHDAERAQGDVHARKRLLRKVDFHVVRPLLSSAATA